MNNRLSHSAQWLGAAGLVPQIAALAAACSTSLHYTGVAAGCMYAAVILSFLGGVWWTQALIAQPPRWIDHAIAVAPSLIGFGAMLPWCFGWNWPGPSLLVLGAVLLASPVIDQQLAARCTLPPGWLLLRRRLSVGLGMLTLALALT